MLIAQSHSDDTLTVMCMQLFHSRSCFVLLEAQDHCWLDLPSVEREQFNISNHLRPQQAVSSKLLVFLNLDKRVIQKFVDPPSSAGVLLKTA